jgi:hypothetical protein
VGFARFAHELSFTDGEVSPVWVLSIPIRP